MYIRLELIFTSIIDAIENDIVSVTEFVPPFATKMYNVAFNGILEISHSLLFKNS
ncbi:hypothetical protein ACX281_10480 (plasmid) [Cetobacterium somerae]